MSTSTTSARSFPVLARMLEHNALWSKDVQKIEPDFFQKLAVKQSPKVLWIGCSDSRVPESVLLAARPGELFVHRNIANQVHLNDDSAMSVLTFAVDELGVEHVIVCGHTWCGGIAGAHALSSAPKPATTALLRWLGPLVDLSKSLALESEAKEEAMPKLLAASVTKQVENVAESSIVKEAWARGKKLFVHGWIYHCDSGLVQDLEVSKGPEAATFN